jgi:hypothetical protein
MLEARNEEEAATDGNNILQQSQHQVGNSAA